MAVAIRYVTATEASLAWEWLAPTDCGTHRLRHSRLLVAERMRDDRNISDGRGGTQARQRNLSC